VAGVVALDDHAEGGGGEVAVHHGAIGLARGIRHALLLVELRAVAAALKMTIY